LVNSETGREQLDVVEFTVKLRSLSSSQVRAYVRRERPFDCAGGFRSEGLGVALFEWMAGSDPSALVGLPLIRLTEMLSAEGWDVLCVE
jgi:predicted house-cleaning NTP pyrophosphatase (Maf/HAM1 superfamily)